MHATCLQIVQADGFPGEPRDKRPGYLLHEESRLTKIAILRNYYSAAVDCLSYALGLAASLCRLRVIGLIFRDHDSEATANDIVDCALTYVEEPEGEMPRTKRPAS